MAFPRRRVLGIPLALLVAATGAAHARYEGNLNLVVGKKWLQNGDWAPVEEQQDIGLMFAFAEERIPVQFAFDVFRSHDNGPSGAQPDGTPVDGQTTEFAVGFRKTWGTHVFHPHLGAGGNVIQAEMNTASPTGQVNRGDRGYGVWIDGGMTWRVAGHLNLGFEVRYSKADVDLSSGFETMEAAAGGLHVGGIIGYGW